MIKTLEEFGLFGLCYTDVVWHFKRDVSIVAVERDRDTIVIASIEVGRGSITINTFRRNGRGVLDGFNSRQRIEGTYMVYVFRRRRVRNNNDIRIFEPGK